MSIPQVPKDVGASSATRACTRSLMSSRLRRSTWMGLPRDPPTPNQVALSRIERAGVTAPQGDDHIGVSNCVVGERFGELPQDVNVHLLHRLDDGGVQSVCGFSACDGTFSGGSSWLDVLATIVGFVTHRPDPIFASVERRLVPGLPPTHSEASAGADRSSPRPGWDGQSMEVRYSSPAGTVGG